MPVCAVRTEGTQDRRYAGPKVRRTEGTQDRRYGWIYSLVFSSVGVVGVPSSVLTP